jgi:EpsI family protein
MVKPSSSAFVATAALLLGTAALSKIGARRIPETLVLPLSSIATEVDGWKAAGDQTLDPATLRVLAPTSYLYRSYEKAGSRLDLFIAFYAQQRAGESMHSPKHCLPGAGWEIWKLGSAGIPFAGKQVPVNRYSIENQGVRRLMFYWYQSKRRVIASEYLGKVLLARDAILTGQTAGSIVRVTLADTPEAVEEGAGFTAAVLPQVARCLGGTPAATHPLD